MDYRSATEHDHAAIAQVVHASFGDQADAVVGVLDDLRARADVRAEIVADDDGAIVGHVALSHAWLDARERLVDVLVLSPLGVRPERQRQGIGTALLQAARATAAELGVPLVFLEGSPDYYGSRGWARAADHGLERPSARIPYAACQVVLLPGHEPWMTGRLVYPDPWWRRDLVGLRDPLLAQIEDAAG